MSTHISKNYTSKNYTDLNLDVNNLVPGKWNKAIRILEQRINERFIEPINLLIQLENTLVKKDKDKKYGFVILSIDCLLLETIQSFYDGVTDSRGKSKTLITDFLEKREFFKTNFNTPGLRNDFYDSIRCALLHQGQTNKGVLVKATMCKNVSLNEDDKIKIIYRSQFHKSLVAEFKLYIRTLKGLDNRQDLMTNFKKKMDFIASEE